MTTRELIKTLGRGLYVAGYAASGWGEATASVPTVPSAKAQSATAAAALAEDRATSSARGVLTRLLRKGTVSP